MNAEYLVTGPDAREKHQQRIRVVAVVEHTKTDTHTNTSGQSQRTTDASADDDGCDGR